MPDDVIAMVMGLTLTAIVFSAFIVTFIVLAKKTRAKKAQDEQATRDAQASIFAQKKVDKQPMSLADKHELHQKDAHEHGHEGDEEHYEEIVGSLGVVNDEGCEDLSGVRFIAHDFAYDTVDSDAQDYAGLARVMILGDVLNNPRFKNPYSRK